MQLGLFSYSYHLAFGKHPDFSPGSDNRMDIFEFMDRTEEMDLDGIQLDILHLKEHTDAYLNKVRKYAEDKEFFIEYGSTGVEKEHILKELEIAQKLNASIMRTFMGFNRYDDAINPDEEIKKAGNVLREVTSKAKEKGIKIAVENHCDATTDELLELMQLVDSEQVGICADLGNFMIHNEEPVQAISNLAPYILSTHFKDYDVLMENYGFKTYGVPLGEGVIDLENVLKILREKSPLERIILEIPVEPEKEEQKALKKEQDYIEKSVTYARNTLGIG